MARLKLLGILIPASIALSGCEEDATAASATTEEIESAPDSAPPASLAPLSNEEIMAAIERFPTFEGGPWAIDVAEVENGRSESHSWMRSERTEERTNRYLFREILLPELVNFSHREPINGDCEVSDLTVTDTSYATSYVCRRPISAGPDGTEFADFHFEISGSFDTRHINVELRSFRVGADGSPRQAITRQLSARRGD